VAVEHFVNVSEHATAKKFIHGFVTKLRGISTLLVKDIDYSTQAGPQRYTLLHASMQIQSK